MSAAVVDKQTPLASAAGVSAAAPHALAGDASGGKDAASPVAAEPQAPDAPSILAASADVASVSAAPGRLALTCPYCQCRIFRDKPMEGRTSGRCPACRRKIWVDPFQQLFVGRLCLTNVEATHVDFLMRLCDLPCGQPVVRRLSELRTALAAGAGAASNPETVVCEAFRLAAEQCIDPDEDKCLRELRRGYRSFLRRASTIDKHDKSRPSSETDGSTHR